jgi:hypothetical protein
MTERTVRLLVPTATSAAPRRALSRRPEALGTVAFLHNGQPFYDDIAPVLVELLAARPGVTVRQFRKPRYSSPADAAVLDEIGSTASAAVVGLAC